MSSEKQSPISMSEVFDELKSIGEEPEEITETTLEAVKTVVEDSRRKSDTKSFLAIITFVTKKHSALSSRIHKLERLVLLLIGGGTGVSVAWELFKTFYLHK